DVLAHHAKNGELYSADKRHQHRDRRPAGYRIHAGQLDDDRPDSGHKRKDRDEKADLEHHPERRRREADDPVEGQSHELGEWPFGRPGKASRPYVRYAYLLESYPAEHPADVAIPLAHRPESIQRTPVHQPEIADVERNVHVADAAERPVEQSR